MKKCNLCGEEKPPEQYQKSKHTRDGYANRCKDCMSKQKAEDYKKRWFKYQIRLKRSFSKKRGIPFNLTEDYLKDIWTDTCPVFGLALVRHAKSHDMCPALDRIDPKKGYTKGNVRYISARANRIKYDATIEELRQVLKYMESSQDSC